MSLSSQVPQGVSEVSQPKSKFLIQIIVLDDHELIDHVIQGLSLSTASLVGSLDLEPERDLGLLKDKMRNYDMSELPPCSRDHHDATHFEMLGNARR